MSILVDFISDTIQTLYGFTGSLGIPNYGLAIIIFTVLLKIIMLPLTVKQVKSMGKMQELQPRIQEIQKKHKDNPQKSQQMVMEIYQKEKVNPFAGCLPLLVQMPILFALFSALRYFFDPAVHPEVQMEHATFIWITNLGQPDLYILPLLTAVATFAQQWFSMVNKNDQTQKTFLYIMPVFMGWISRSFPSGLALYWVVYSVVSAVEYLLIRRSTGIAKEAAKG
ncbi:MAG: membrane protein insertase YidC [Syntrophomonadaceae bacterium]|nr:membrane protein insertase YidC [Syntrophomonadaceae bacterium]